MNDQQFQLALEDCSLAPADFNHAAHVRAAYLYLTQGDFGWALDRIRLAIQRYATTIGHAGKYHETMTVAFAALVRQHIHERGCAQDWPSFAAANPELFDAELLTRFYSPDQLASPLARRVFLLPEPQAPRPSKSRRADTSALS